ncbi:MAG: hypothetical protein IJH63_03780 [Methanobrevibacter sp.]|uniref:DUF3899 domain-containing protein n=1 Tax=Methanobrevibacter millerae TaxID=230361 RepID=A0A8T3VED1_9EURY|nr:hypothetical protein [Methanobrevibacter millerae]MBE6504586.1 hypothetical protein [Methanobrevibacter millerae]MBR0058320.1 hypothetical protein [Methanobrevibacter sp.]MBR0369827.1 hypothetical protein [Methanobrevibacter sp.]
MIINKYISLVITGVLFLMLMLLLSSLVMLINPGMNIVYSGIIVIFFVFICRAFYNFLRNDDQYKNTRKRSSDIEGESYITKGESDIKKTFVIVWVFLMTILLAVTFIIIA